MSQMPRIASLDALKRMISSVVVYRNQALCVLIVLVSGLIAKNILDSGNREKVARGKQQEEIIRQQQIKNRLTQAEKDLNEVADQLLESDFFVLKGIIEKIAREAALKIVSLKPGAENVLPAYKKMEVTMTTKGDYPSVVKFMDALEEINLPIEIVSLQIALESGSRQVERTLNINLKIMGIAKKAEARSEERSRE